jgi:hypothetical protein
MAAQQNSDGGPKLTFKQQMGILLPFAWDRILEQIKCVWFVLAYLMLFQILVLGLGIVYSLMIAVGIAITIVGLAFFMEGLRLGLMPLGEILGSTLPRKKLFGFIPCLPASLGFGLILGVFATFAEPAIAVLQAAGSSVRPDQAPLLYTLLNDYSGTLVACVGFGVGVAVLLGVLRFYKGWSLKPFIVVAVVVLSSFTIYFQGDAILKPVLGLAWDCGAVTTGPVTVPLVLALGIGVCRIVSTGGSSNTGFGVVTLASVFPILAVMLLSLYLKSKDDYYGTKTFDETKGNAVLVQYIIDQKKDAVKNTYNEEGKDTLGLTEADYKSFKGKDEPKTVPEAFTNKSATVEGIEEIKAFITELKGLQPAGNNAPVENFTPEELEQFKRDGSLPENYEITFIKPSEGVAVTSEESIILSGAKMKLIKLGDPSPVPPSSQWQFSKGQTSVTDDMKARFSTGFKFFPVDARGALEAAIFAIVPLSVILLLFLMVGLGQKPKYMDELVVGITCATIGMTLFGLGISIGLTPLGEQLGANIVTAFQGIKPWEFESGIKAPLIDGDAGKIIAIIFAFILGYGATLAEPALNALGSTVEKITVGAFKKSLLMQTVALGVGCGIATGVAKIAFDLELWHLLLPPYLLLIPITLISSEDFVNFGWDSAGVTTGPITVPLVLAMGLGIGAKTGAIDGFGVLALASVGPIMTVLIVGLIVKKKPKKVEEENEATQTQAEAA